MLEIRWPDGLWELFEELPPRDQTPILSKVSTLPLFPEMYPVRRSGEFKGCRYFVAGKRPWEWLVYYLVRRDAIWIRGFYPARAEPR
jgi:hypothetical protein